MKESKISKRFNSVLFVFLCFATTINYLFEPETQEITPWDTIYNISPLISIVTAVAFGLVLILGSAKLVQNIWNRFVLDIFKVRDITFQEALAIVLITGILLKII